MTFSAVRTALQTGIYRIINPFVRLLIKLGFTPNAVTLTGLALNIGVAIIFIAGGEEGNRGDLRYVGWGGALILFAGLFDMLDGQVARLGNMKSEYGALFDSVLDRYSELFTFLGICYYLVAHHYLLGSLFAFIALIGSMMVSYTRARAEGLGVESKGGLMQRPERVVLIGVSALACGVSSAYLGGDYKLFIPGVPFHVFETMSILTFPITVLAVLSNITAVSRLLNARKPLEAKEALAAASPAAPYCAKSYRHCRRYCAGHRLVFQQPATRRCRAAAAHYFVSGTLGHRQPAILPTARPQYQHHHLPAQREQRGSAR
jgi:phosphatidylglycerophosphate synthase